MKAIDILHATIGTVSSKPDASVSFRVNTPELRPSEAGALMGWHGKACRVTIFPDAGEEPEETVVVSTEAESKTPSERLRSCLYVLWTERNKPDSFPIFYAQSMEKLIDHVKAKLP